ncbi:serine hydrolase domain-containing protein [Inhella sp.]|uniref:serine hydrolase domain-containing protein n=1 Tax=Inhella sp. TaxID=1921806 RepID=UPI0035B20875
MPPRRLAMLLTVAALGATAAAQSPRAMRGTAATDRAQQVLRALENHPQDPLPGWAAAVGQGRRVVFSQAAGLADLQARRTTTPQTRVRVYSVAKSIGAAAAMRLAEAGRLDLDAPIASYLPSLPAHLRAITVRQLLAHRSGVRHYRPGEWASVSDFNCATPAQALPDFVDDPLLFKPGQGYQYSTFGYVLLSAVLEAAAGQPFDALMRELVFEPAGMNATAIEGRPLPEMPGLPAQPVAVFYDRSEAGRFSPTTGIDASCKYLGGGLVSTAEDLVRFGLALLDGRLVSPAGLAQMLRVHSEGGENHPPYGYGFFPGENVLTTAFSVPVEDVEPAWWHGGSGRGGYAVLILYPKQRAAAAITTNVRASGRLVRATHTMALPFLRP